MSVSIWSAHAAPESDHHPAFAPVRQIDWWGARHEAKLREVAQRGAEIDLVFLGDSITQALERPDSAKVIAETFPGMTVLNLGYNADKTENVLWRLRNGEIDGLSPKAVVVMIGTNNSGHRMDPPEITAKGIRLILEDLHAKMPNAKIVLLSIFPRGDAAHPNNQQINALLPALADGKNIFHINLNDTFFDANGQVPPDIMPDKLHPSVKGDALWIKALKPHLDQILAS
jgi:beta-glucosidase